MGDPGQKWWDIGNVFFGGNLNRLFLDLIRHHLGAASMPRLSSIGLAPAARFFQTFSYDRMRQYRRSSRAITSDIVGFGCGFFEQLRPIFSNGFRAQFLWLRSHHHE